MDLVIRLEGCNSVVIRDNDQQSKEIAWIHDPIGFVHPDGPFFD